MEWLWIENIMLTLYLALQGGDELAVLAEHRQVEVVVVISDGDLARSVDSDTNRVVGDSWIVNGLYRLNILLFKLDIMEFKI